jgi:hypothetical protein
MLVESGVWRFYRERNYNGNENLPSPRWWFDLGPGHYPSVENIKVDGRFLGNVWNKAISSCEPIRYQ